MRVQSICTVSMLWHLTTIACVVRDHDGQPMWARAVRRLCHNTSRNCMLCGIGYVTRVSVCYFGSACSGYAIPLTDTIVEVCWFLVVSDHGSEYMHCRASILVLEVTHKQQAGW